MAHRLAKVGEAVRVVESLLGDLGQLAVVASVPRSAENAASIMGAD